MAFHKKPWVTFLISSGNAQESVFVYKITGLQSVLLILTKTLALMNARESNHFLVENLKP